MGLDFLTSHWEVAQDCEKYRWTAGPEGFWYPRRDDYVVIWPESWRGGRHLKSERERPQGKWTTEGGIRPEVELIHRCNHQEVPNGEWTLRHTPYCLKWVTIFTSYSKLLCNILVHCYTAPTVFCTTGGWLYVRAQWLKWSQWLTVMTQVIFVQGTTNCSAHANSHNWFQRDVSWE